MSCMAQTTTCITTSYTPIAMPQQPVAPVVPQVAGAAGGGPQATSMSSVVSALQGVVTALQGVVNALGAVIQAQGGAGALGGGPGQGLNSYCCQSGNWGAKAPAQAAPGGDIPAVPLPPQGAQPAAVDSGPPPPPAGGGDGKLTEGGLTVKGQAISDEQRSNIEQVLAVGKEMGADRRTMEAAVATMIQESNAQNLDYGDRDSLGLFQQRPSQGWGTPEQVRDPKHAARKFFERAIPTAKDNPDMSLTQLSQAVQRSAFPDAYAKWSDEAKKIVDAFES